VDGRDFPQGLRPVNYSPQKGLRQQASAEPDAKTPLRGYLQFGRLSAEVCLK